MKLKLPTSISSRQDLKAVTLELQHYLHWFSQDQIKQQVAGAAYGDQPRLSPAAIELVRQSQGDKPADKDSLAQLIKALEALAVKAEYVTVTLAAPASASLREAIVDWFRRNVRADLLVDFSFNSTMLGGMAVRCGSRVFDWSFKRQILANRAKFPEVLRNV